MKIKYINKDKKKVAHKMVDREFFDKFGRYSMWNTEKIKKNLLRMPNSESKYLNLFYKHFSNLYAT